MKKRFEYTLTFDLIVGDRTYECHVKEWLSNVLLRAGDTIYLEDNVLEHLTVKGVIWYADGQGIHRDYGFVLLEEVHVEEPASQYQYLIDNRDIDYTVPDLCGDGDGDEQLTWKEQLYKAAGSTPPDDASALHEAYMEEKEKVEWGPQEEPDSWGSWGEPVWRDYLQCSSMHDADIEKKAKAERGRRLLASADKVIATAAIHEEVLRKKHLGAV